MASPDFSSVAKELFRIGVVKSTDPEKATVRVEIEDADKLQSFDLPVIVRNTLKNKDYWMPDIDEQVVCFFLGNGLSSGFILGSFYQDVDTPPVKEQDKRHVLFGDGSWLQYDRKEHLLSGEIKGDVDLKVTGNVNLKVDGDCNTEIGGDNTVKIGGDYTVEVGGEINVTADGNHNLKGEKINLNE